jgi:hypothetical protein
LRSGSWNHAFGRFWLYSASYPDAMIARGGGRMENPKSKKSLDRGSTLVYGEFSGRIDCEEGILWLSWKGSDDLFLFSGESAALSRAKALIIQPLRSRAEFRVLSRTSPRS